MLLSLHAKQLAQSLKPEEPLTKISYHLLGAVCARSQVTLIIIYKEGTFIPILAKQTGEKMSQLNRSGHGVRSAEIQTLIQLTPFLLITLSYNHWKC